MTKTIVLDEAAFAKAFTKFIEDVRSQDADWTDEADEEILLVSPGGDFFAPEYPLRAFLSVYLKADGSP